MGRESKGEEGYKYKGGGGGGERRIGVEEETETDKKGMMIMEREKGANVLQKSSVHVYVPQVCLSLQVSWFCLSPHISLW